MVPRAQNEQTSWPPRELEAGRPGQPPGRFPARFTTDKRTPLSGVPAVYARAVPSGDQAGVPSNMTFVTSRTVLLSTGTVPSRVPPAVDTNTAIRRPSGDSRGPEYRFGNRHRLAPEEALPERFPLDERHHEVEGVGRGAGVEDRQDVRVLQLGSDRDLAEEPGLHQRGRELRPQHLDRDRPLVLEIDRPIHRRGRAGAELVLDPITLGQRPPETVDNGWRGQDPRMIPYGP